MRTTGQALGLFRQTDRDTLHHGDRPPENFHRSLSNVQHYAFDLLGVYVTDYRPSV